LLILVNGTVAVPVCIMLRLNVAIVNTVLHLHVL
jgi:hypothetical protein